METLQEPLKSSRFSYCCSDLIIIIVIIARGYRKSSNCSDSLSFLYTFTVLHNIAKEVDKWMLY